MSMTIWEELGIEATADAGAINDAYAARAGLMRPGEDLEAFLRLRAAHAAALHMADNVGDAELWLGNTRLQAKSWKYWIGQSEPAAARILLGSEPLGLSWFAPPELVLTEIPIRDLPLYSADFDADFPPVARAFKQSIADVDAVLFVTPEYNRSIPGGLKNAIDWASRPWGKNSFTRKPSAVIGVGISGRL